MNEKNEVQRNLQSHNASYAMTKVIFRKYKDGDILALFPQVPADDLGVLCSSYQHIGQHGGADYTLCISKTKPATPEEYAKLKAELENSGYCLIVRQKATYQDHRNRIELAQHY